MLTVFRIGTKRRAVDFKYERKANGFRYNEHCDILTNNLISAMRDCVDAARKEAQMTDEQMQDAMDVADSAPQIVELDVTERKGGVIICRIIIPSAERFSGTVKAMNNCVDFAKTMKAYALQYRDDARSGESKARWLKSMVVECPV